MEYKDLEQLKPDLEILVRLLMNRCGFTKKQAVECLCVTIEAILK